MTTTISGVSRPLRLPPSAIFPADLAANNLEGDTYGVELSANYQVLDGWRLHSERL